MGVEMAGLRRQSRFITRQRFRQAAQIFQHIAAIVQRAGIIGPDGQRPAVSIQRLFQTPQPLQRHAVMQQGLGRLGSDLQRFCDVRGGFAIAPLLQAQHPQHVAGTEMPRVRA